ncbi:MAG: SDR family oxidoreductase [Deltaproteobacteria bacterium]|nr:SDR family oxidoreductase [Deltaproteobacteria bacterium]
MPTVVITGANRGIGLELARLCKQRGDQVIAICRHGSPALKDLEIRVEEHIDVTEQPALDQLRERLSGVSIDILINNAGILTDESLTNFSADRVRRQFEVNALGPLSVTIALLANLRPGSKVALITSRMGSIADNTSGGRYGYRMSKAALNAAGASLAYDLAEHKIAVAILHPGFVRTEMTNGSGLIDADEAAANLLARIDDLSIRSTGTFWHADGQVLPW